MGRTRTKNTATKKPDTTPNAPVVTRSEVDQFSEWLDSMPAYLNDAVYNPRIVAALIAEGWTISRAARGKVITGKASA